MLVGVDTSVLCIFHLLVVCIGILASFFAKRLDLVLLFRERGREGEKARGARETSISCLSFEPHLETKPETQACALTAIRGLANFPSVRQRSNPRSRASQGRHSFQAGNSLFSL